MPRELITESLAGTMTPRKLSMKFALDIAKTCERLYQQCDLELTDRLDSQTHGALREVLGFDDPLDLSITATVLSQLKAMIHKEVQDVAERFS